MSKWFQAVLALCAVVFVGAVCFAAWQTARVEQALSDDAQARTALEQGIADSQKDIADKITKPCTPIKGQQLTIDNVKDCGTLAYADVVMAAMRGAFGQFSKASEANVKFSGDLHATQVALEDAIKDLGGTARAATGTLDQGTETLKQINDKDHGVGATLANVNGGVADFKTYMKSKAMEQTVADFQTTIRHFAGMSASGDLMLADAEWKEHQLLHPDKVKLTFWTGADATAMWIHKHLEPPLF